MLNSVVVNVCVSRLGQGAPRLLVKPCGEQVCLWGCLWMGLTSMRVNCGVDLNKKHLDDWFSTVSGWLIYWRGKTRPGWGWHQSISLYRGWNAKREQKEVLLCSFGSTPVFAVAFGHLSPGFQHRPFHFPILTHTGLQWAAGLCLDIPPPLLSSVHTGLSHSSVSLPCKSFIYHILNLLL